MIKKSDEAKSCILARYGDKVGSLLSGVGNILLGCSAIFAISKSPDIGESIGKLYSAVTSIDSKTSNISQIDHKVSLAMSSLDRLEALTKQNEIASAKLKQGLKELCLVLYQQRLSAAPQKAKDNVADLTKWLYESDGPIALPQESLLRQAIEIEREKRRREKQEKRKLSPADEIIEGLKNVDNNPCLNLGDQG